VWGGGGGDGGDPACSDAARSWKETGPPRARRGGGGGGGLRQVVGEGPPTGRLSPLGRRRAQPFILTLAHIKRQEELAK
jgi:hypothetical protein